MHKKILLVEPDFPIPNKSKNHQNFLPIGLLKIATYLRNCGEEVKLIRGYPKINELDDIKNFMPEEIWVSSLFTYWSKYVKSTVKYYKTLFPNAIIKVGGIYASLLPVEEVKAFTGCDQVIQGVIPEAEECLPDYSLLNNINGNTIDYQIIHSSRGCERKCAFCGTWIIEPEFLPQKSIKDKIKYKKLVFYDNNFFMNPYVEDILNELIELKKEKKIIWCESQSGFDGRLLIKKPYLAEMIKKAGFRYPRIAWDWGYKQWPEIEKQLNILINAGYKSKDIYIFVLYNWNTSFEEMELKRKKCWEWKVQISDCRYRPLHQLYDNYKPRVKGQTSKDYYIHEKYGWTDDKVKQFRRNIRMQNICIRHGFPFYSKVFEHKSIGKETIKKEYPKETEFDIWSNFTKVS
jgi:hypothetical protein